MAKARFKTKERVVLSLTQDEANVVYALVGHVKLLKEAYSVCAALEDVMEFPVDLQIRSENVEYGEYESADNVELNLEGWSNT